jgi:hypothetical protein
MTEVATPSVAASLTSSTAAAVAATAATATTTGAAGATATAEHDGELVVRVSVPSLSARRTVKLLMRHTVADVIEQLFSTYHTLDSTAVYGIAVSDEVSGYVLAADNGATLASLNVKDGDTLVFGPLTEDRTSPRVISQSTGLLNVSGSSPLSSLAATAQSDGVVVAIPDQKHAPTRWAATDWNVTEPTSEKLLVSVEHVAAGVTKLVQWNTSKKIGDVLAEFCEKVGAGATSDFAFFYVPHGLPGIYEVQMLNSESVAAYEQNLLLSTVVFRRL